MVLCFVLYLNRAKISSYLLSKHFHLDVDIENIDFIRNGININNFVIHNPIGSKTQTALYTKDINIDAPLRDLMKKTFTIESITLRDIVIGIEYYDVTGEENNWNRIMLIDVEEDKASTREYLIKTLTLENLQVYLTKSSGTVIKFPVIHHLEFHDISNKTGFPLNKLEKALMQAVIRSVFSRIGLGNLVKTLNPLKVVPKILELPFSGENETTKENENTL